MDIDGSGGSSLIARNNQNLKPNGSSSSSGAFPTNSNNILNQDSGTSSQSDDSDSPPLQSVLEFLQPFVHVSAAESRRPWWEALPLPADCNLKRHEGGCPAAAAEGVEDLDSDSDVEGESESDAEPEGELEEEEEDESSEV